jgi:hypothetical protein
LSSKERRETKRGGKQNELREGRERKQYEKEGKVTVLNCSKSGQR